MKKILVASFMIFSYNSSSCSDVILTQDRGDGRLHADIHKILEEHESMKNDDKDDSLHAYRYKPSHIDLKSHPADFVRYDDQQKLRAIESVGLQQQDGDVIESVAFNFEDIDLLNVAQYMERVHKVKFITDDILDPSRSTQKLTGNKISFRTNAPLSKQESWSLFITFLSMAGLDVVPMSQAGFYRIVPLPGAAQEALPAYIGSDPELLPDNDMMVRYVYFMQNGDPSSVQQLIAKFQGSHGSLMLYKDLKALIFTDKSYNIRSLMKIVKELDKPVAPQVISVVKLKKANVEDVKNLYESLRPSNMAQQRAWAPDSKDLASEFFSQKISLATDKRTNTLIILGPKDAVARLEDFIAKYVDIDANTTKAPVFVYYLEYTNAIDMQRTISQLVSYGSQTSAGQVGGVRDGQKYLQPMTIVADNHSNSLIINATAEDYAAVEKLLKQLDVPQKQIALEVLIVQVSGVKSKALGSQISGPNADNTFLRSVQAQTSGIPPTSGIVVTPNENGIAESIKSNLASLLLSPAVNEAGATLLTFGQPIWAIFKILKTISTSKILQNPFMVVSNNSRGLVKVGVSRRVVTGEAISAGNTTASGYQTAEANLSVEIVPQVNDQQIINMAIKIDNNQFVNGGAHDAVQDQKSITTMASVANGEVLVLGGIMGDTNVSSTSGVPFLSKIPVFGWLFKNKSNVQGKNIFMVFICPKVIENIYSQEDVQEYTRNKIEEAQDYLRLMDEVEVVDSGQDPIDRAFFGDIERRSDDLSSNRLLDRAELVSHHEVVKKERVQGKPHYSKYHKVSADQQQIHPQSSRSSLVRMIDQEPAKSTRAAENQKVSVRNTKARKQHATKQDASKYKKFASKNMKTVSIDMSEKNLETSQSSVNSIKNMVQQTAGGVTL